MKGGKYPDQFVVHYEVARMNVAKGEYENAIKEMKIALNKSDELFKPFLEGLLKRLEAREDINKP